VVDSKKNIGLPQEGEGTSEGAGSPQPATTIITILLKFFFSFTILTKIVLTCYLSSSSSSSPSLCFWEEREGVGSPTKQQQPKKRLIINH
jgi:hypothetical protein